jgi:HEPN domain-containing protein
MNPPNRKRLPSSPEEWLLHARSDLHIVRLGLKETGILPHQLCFHAQQTAEKAIKAVLIQCKLNFPLTHDIQRLLRILESAGIIVPLEIQDADLLSPYAVETRYPGYWGDISREDVQEAIHLAETVLKWAERIISGSE